MSDLSLRILANLSLYSIIIPIVFGLVTWKQQDFSMKILVLGFGLYFFIFLCSVFISLQFPKGFFSYLSTFSDCIFFSVFYYCSLKDVVLKKYILASLAFVSIFLVLDYTLIYLNGNHAQYSFLAKNIFLLALSFIVITKLMLQISIQSLARNFLVWIALTKSILIGYSLIYELLEDRFFKDYLRVYIVMYALDLGFHIIAQFSYAKGIYLGRSRKVLI
jgi:hypothetical protein